MTGALWGSCDLPQRTRIIEQELPEGAFEGLWRSSGRKQGLGSEGILGNSAVFLSPYSINTWARSGANLKYAALSGKLCRGCSYGSSRHSCHCNQACSRKALWWKVLVPSNLHWLCTGGRGQAWKRSLEKTVFLSLLAILVALGIQAAREMAGPQPGSNWCRGTMRDPAKHDRTVLFSGLCLQQDGMNYRAAALNVCLLL